jgi:hypothetical protein
MPFNKLNIEELKTKALKTQSDNNKSVATKAGLPSGTILNSNTKAHHIQKSLQRVSGQTDAREALKSILHSNIPVHGVDDMGGENRSKSIRELVRNKSIDAELGEDMIEMKKLVAFTQLQIQMQQAKGQFVGMEGVPMYQKTLKPWLEEKSFESSMFETWIPTLNTSFYFDEVRIDPGIEQFFGTYTMKAKEERVNTLLGKLKGRLQLETDTYGSQGLTSSSINFSAQDNVAHTQVYSNLLQDSDPNAFNNQLSSIVEGLAIARECAIINGDDTRAVAGAGHQGDAHFDIDTAALGRFEFEKAFKGLRKLAYANSANGVLVNHGGGVIDKSIFQSLIRSMPIFVKNKAECLWVVSTSMKRLIDSGVIAELLSTEFISRGLIETGERGTLFGIPFYESQYMRDDLGASGVYEAASTQTSIILVNRKRFFMGMRSPVRLWATPSLANQDLLMMTGKERISFAGATQSATEKSIALGRNISSLGE